MSDNPQIRAVPEYVEARERELDEEAGQLRSRIEELTARLGELDAESESLRITRKTLLSIPAPTPAAAPDRPDVPDHPAYQQRTPHLNPNQKRALRHVPHSQDAAANDVITIGRPGVVPGSVGPRGG